MSKTYDDLLTFQYVSANSVVVSSEIDVSTASVISLFAGFCQTDNSAVTNPPKYAIEGQSNTSSWYRLVSWFPLARLPSKSEIEGTAVAGQNSLVVQAIPTAWKVGQLGFILHEIDSIPNNLTKSEFVRVKKITALTKTIETVDPLTYNHPDTSDETGTLYNYAERWMTQINVASVSKIRLVIDASGTNKQFVAQAFTTILDSE